MAAMTRIKISGEGTGVETRVRAGRHTVVVDEHPAMGGADAGPSPLEYALASLVSCEEVIAQLAAREMGIIVDRIEWDVQADLDRRGLMGDQKVQPFFQSVRVRAGVPTDAAPAQFRQLQKAVDRRCPVFTMMRAAGISMDAEWVKG